MIDWTDVEREARNETERAWRQHYSAEYRLRYALARVYVLWIGRWLK